MLYRVAQEGLTNVRKHAQAGRVEVVLAYDNDKVGLSIVDDGQGMGETANGYGLIGLRERVQLVGGRVKSILEPSVTAKVVAEFARLVNQASRPQALESPLSEREIEVLRLVTKGATNREIAATLVSAAAFLIQTVFSLIAVNRRTTIRDMVRRW